jgi:hypothetical protein
LEPNPASRWTMAKTIGTGVSVGAVAAILLNAVIGWFTKSQDAAQASAEKNQAFIQDTLINRLDRSTEKMADQALSNNFLGQKIEKLADRQGELNAILKPLSVKLGNVANAVNEQVEQVKEQVDQRNAEAETTK